ncbi:hypothetical protein [Nocardia wallacei]|uniref:hypothetical protein n=1 Tax=Nocardia wallacei TaxID=480035 RepID=UPI002455557A|nr:hypothetical protein [Nocardia wallacei]
MDSSGDGSPGGPADEGSDTAAAVPAAHMSTGRLTARQARIVAAWRQELLVSDPKRWWRTRDHRPPASSSDCLAAAVIELLDDAEPTPIQLVCGHARIREELAAERGRAFPAVSTASVYVPGDYADRIGTLLTAAHEFHAEALAQARAQAESELPGAAPLARGLRYATSAAEHGVPLRVYRIPAATVVRLAIERWSRKAPATVVGNAVAHGERWHTQVHRAREDMGVDQRKR